MVRAHFSVYMIAAGKVATQPITILHMFGLSLQTSNVAKSYCKGLMVNYIWILKLIRKSYRCLFPASLLAACLTSALKIYIRLKRRQPINMKVRVVLSCVVYWTILEICFEPEGLLLPLPDSFYGHPNIWIWSTNKATSVPCPLSSRIYFYTVCLLQ